MRAAYCGLIGAVSLLIGIAGAFAEQPTSVAAKVALQAAMQRHINSQLVDGAYLQLNPKSGEVRPLHPVKAHPIILTMGDYFILCSDFRDAKGKSVNIDFYMARQGDRYVVFHSAVDNRDLLERLMDAGDVRRFE